MFTIVRTRRPQASVAYHLLHVFAEADAQEALEPPPRNRGSGVAREHRQHQRAAKQRPRRRPDRACFVWTSRERAALAEWFPELIQAMARSPRFDVQLYCSAFDSPDVESAPHNHRRSSAGAAGRASQASSSGVSAVGGSAVELMSLVPPSPPPTAHAGRSPSNGSPPGGRGGAGAGGLPQPPPLRGSRAAASPLEASLSLELLRGGRPDLDVVVASAIARAHASGGGRAQQPCLGELRAAVLACGPESLMAGAQARDGSRVRRHRTALAVRSPSTSASACFLLLSLPRICRWPPPSMAARSTARLLNSEVIFIVVAH